MNWLQLLLQTLPGLISILPQLLSAIAEISKNFNALPAGDQQQVVTAVKTIITHVNAQ